MSMCRGLHQRLAESHARLLRRPGPAPDRLCIDCRHYRVRSRLGDQLCMRPVEIPDPVMGRRTGPKAGLAQIERLWWPAFGGCGRTARYFQPLETSAPPIHPGDQS